MTEAYSKPYPASERQPLHGQMVAVMTYRADDSNKALMQERSRALRRYEVHELLVTTDEAAPGGTVNRTAFLGFFEIAVPGLLVTGDRLITAVGEIGRVVGFDSNHMPNHLNIVIGVDELQTGEDLGLHIGGPVTFQPWLGEK
ncbi:MAG: hypothetical protein WD314_09500 [Trueperaceae bacterium]